ncbi:hypothetical protein [Acrocarpospora catenulata]|uniref:hypothetical protein n=1 Tax=Acrocarpospora catenulata TaxID=2836182 RepID=UPI001BD9580F|nr:hypothetical protein [Acrocarpospora catenulata]
MPYPVPNPRTWGAEFVTPPKLRDLGDSIAFLRQKPLFQGYQATAQAVPDQTYVPVNMDVETLDNWAVHSTKDNPSRYPVPVDGWYLVMGHLFVDYTAGSSGFSHSISFRATQNGSATDYRGETRPGGSTHQPGVYGAELLQLSKSTSDYVEMLAWQNTGTTRNLVADVSSSNIKSSVMSVAWVASLTGTTGLAVPSPAAWTSPLTSAQLNAYRDHVRFLTYPPIARLALNSGQGIPTQAWPNGTPIQFDAATVDNYAGWNAGVNPTRYSFARSGVYYLYGMYSCASNATGTRGVGLRINGGTTVWGCHDMPCTATAPAHRVAASRTVRVTAGDYVELMAFQSSGATRNTQGPHAVLIVVWKGA